MAACCIEVEVRGKNLGRFEYADNYQFSRYDESLHRTAGRVIEQAFRLIRSVLIAMGHLATVNMRCQSSRTNGVIDKRCLQFGGRAPP